MKLLLLLALVATAAALDTHSDNKQNLGEAGVDCAESAGQPGLADPVNGDFAPICNCFSNLDRVRTAPTLINNDNNSVAAYETGIYQSNLVVAFTLDSRVFVSDELIAAYNAAQTALNAGWTAVPTLQQTGFWFNSALTGATAKFSDDNSGFEGTNAYEDPSIVYVNQATDADITAGCDMTTNFAIDRSAVTYANYGTTGCGTFNIKSHLPVRDTLKNCGFIQTSTNLDAGAGDIVPNTASTSQRFTEYQGKLKVRTTKYNGNLRGLEVVLKEEFPFHISILYPNLVHVSSSNISIVGEVVTQAAITHQIWDTTNSWVDLNAFIGTSFPYATASSETPGSIGFPLTGSYHFNLTLNPDNYGTTTANHTGVCQGWVDATPVENGGTCENLWTSDGASSVICDNDGDHTCSLGDFFDLTNGGTAGTSTVNWGGYNIPSLITDFANGATVLTGGSALPGTSCIAEQGSDANAAACKQNLHLNLEPRDFYCDLNFDLKLTISVVCRDDADGTGGHTQTWLPTGNTVTAGTTSVTSGGNAFVCDSRTAPKKSVDLYFSTRSDNFCARVVATSTLTADMAVYQSENSVANWGAACGATCLDALTTTSTAADCGAGSSITVPLGTPTNRNLCYQVPLAFADETITIANGGAVADKRMKQSSFVFGTTAYFETRVFSPSGVNLASSVISDLWISSSAATVYPDTVNQGQQGSLTGNWAKQLRAAAGGGSAPALKSYKLANTDAGVAESDVAATSPIDSANYANRLLISDNIVARDLLDNTVDGSGFFTANTNPCFTGSNCHKLGKSFEGVSRGWLLMDEYTIYISDAAEELVEGFKLWATVTVTYKDATAQETLKISKDFSQGESERARLAAAPAISGRSVTATGGVTPAGSATSGSGSSTSTVLGVSATTVLAATVVVGAVVVAAGVGLFVARRSRQNRRAAKRTSSTQELNDARVVQV